jgi:DNA-directed RNA polymerase beta' subunit
MYDTKIVKVQIEKLNLDFERMVDIASGIGIRIDSAESFKKESGKGNQEDKESNKNKKIDDKSNKKNEKVMNGLQSPFFGTDFADENAFSERYSCKCKKYIGKMYENTICDQCKTPVEFIDTDLTKTGWIILNHFKVISPIFAMKLSEALGVVNGERVLDKIIDVRFSNDEKIKDKELQEMKKIPFYKKGMRWLVDNIDEVLDYYSKKKPGKAKYFKELRNDKENIFTSSLPVFSAVLRVETPGEKDKKLFTQKINTLFMSIINSSNKVNDFGRPEEISEKNLFIVDRFLYTMQRDVNDVFDEVFKILNGKKGVIAGRIISGRYNFSARNIIITSARFLRADEVELCYITFMELFRYEIINYYSKLQSCSIIESQNAWKRALVTYNPIFYNIMQHMVAENKEDLNVIINLNPSINFGSFLAMNVAGVKQNINDKTMTINTRVIKTMNADFDGDMLNIFRIVGADLGKKFKKNMNPRYNLYINRLNGKVNPALMPMKDELIGFWQFNNV